MITLLLAAALGGCPTTGYTTYYARPTYAYTYAQAAPVTYAAPVVVALPAYSLVGGYLRDESQYKVQVEQAAQITYLTKLLERQALAVPAPQQAPPVQQYQPQAQYQQPYASPQVPDKATPQAPYQPQAQYPASPQQYQAEPPPYATKIPPASAPPAPSFGGSTWNPPASPGGGVAALTSLLQNRCAQCHVGTSEKGGGVKLLELDGSLAQIDGQLEAIAKAVSSGRMPKAGAKLAPQELQVVFAGLDDYVATRQARGRVLASFGQ